MTIHNQNHRVFPPTKIIAAMLLLTAIFLFSGCTASATQEAGENETISEENFANFDTIVAPELPQASSSDTEQTKTAVILNSFEEDNTITGIYEDGIIEGLRLMGYIEGQNLDVTHLYLNVKTEHNKLLNNTLVISDQVLEINPDVLLITEDDATRNTRSYFYDKEIPVVFSGVNTSSDGNDSALIDLMSDTLDKPGHNMTGVLEKLPISKNLELILQLKPEAENILFLSDNSVTSQELLEQAIINFHNGENEQLNINHIYINSFQQFQETVLAYQDNYDFLMYYFPEGLVNETEGNESETNIIKWIIEQNKKGEICFDEAYIAGGLFGGWVVDYYQLGYHAGLMAGRILEGEDPAEISIINPETYTLYINPSRTGQTRIEIPENLTYQSSTSSKFYNVATIN